VAVPTIHKPVKEAKEAKSSSRTDGCNNKNCVEHFRFPFGRRVNYEENRGGGGSISAVVKACG